MDKLYLAGFENLESSLFIEPKSTDAAFHFSAEEYLARRFAADRKVFMIWRAENCVMLGRNQITHMEVNLAEAERANVQVVRRSSGGGTIFTDMGTILISAITAYRDGDDVKQMLSILSDPLIGAINKFGVEAGVQGRNDIFVNGKKISGMAQYIKEGILVSHCSLLFDTDMGRLAMVLRGDTSKIISKARISTHSHVTNLAEHMPISRGTGEFKDMLKASFVEDLNLTEYELTEKDIREIHEIRLEKYANDDWNISSQPLFSYSNSRRFPGGKTDVHLYIEHGVIKNCSLRGDFLALLPIRELEEKIEGRVYQRENIKKVLASIDPGPYLGTITPDELLSCLFEQA